MSSFREQLGEDWLRYQHHLEGGSTSAIPAIVSTNQPTSQSFANGLNTTPPCLSTDFGRQPSPPLKVPEVLPPPLLSSEPKMETSSNLDADLETESTLQWPSHSTHLTESTLEDSVVDGLVMSHGVVSTPQPSPESQRSDRVVSADANHEEEEDLGGKII